MPAPPGFHRQPRRPGPPLSWNGRGPRDADTGPRQGRAEEGHSGTVTDGPASDIARGHGPHCPATLARCQSPMPSHPPSWARLHPPPARSVVTAGLWAPCPSLLVGQANGGEAPAVPGGSLGPISPRVTKAHAVQETPQWAPRTPRPPPLPSQDGPPHQVTGLAPWMCHPSAQVPQAIRSGQQLPACDFIGEQAVGSGEPGGAWGPPAQGSCLVSAAWGLQTLPVSTRSWPWQLLAAPPPPRHRGLGDRSACRAPLRPPDSQRAQDSARGSGGSGAGRSPKHPLAPWLRARSAGDTGVKSLGQQGKASVE